MREIIHTEPGEPGSWRPSLEEIHSELRIEYERCQEAGVSVVFLQIGIEGLERIEAMRGPDGKELVLRAITDLLRRQPRNGDLYSYRYPGGIVAMLTEMPVEAGEILARILVDGCRRLQLPEDRGTMRLSLCVGVAATQPQEEFFFETMLKVAEEGSSVASASGGECFAHTQLYGLHQRHLEREMPHRKLPSAKRKEREAEAKARPATPARPAAPAKHPAHGDVAANGSRTREEPAPPAPVETRREGSTVVDRASLAAEEPSRMRPVPESVDFDAEMAALHERLHQVLVEDRSARGRSADPERVEEQVLSLADRWVQAVLRKSLEAQAAEHRMEIALLERRIEKLDLALKESELELRRLANASSIDEGVHSAYRDIQGLSKRDGQYDLKHSLMEQLLAANLELYAQISLDN